MWITFWGKMYPLFDATFRLRLVVFWLGMCYFYLAYSNTYQKEKEKDEKTN